VALLILDRVSENVLGSLKGFRIDAAGGHQCDEFSRRLNRLIELVCRHYQLALDKRLRALDCPKTSNDNYCWMIDNVSNLFYTALGVFSNRIADRENLLLGKCVIPCAASVAHFHFLPEAVIEAEHTRHRMLAVPPRSAKARRKREAHDWRPYLLLLGPKKPDDKDPDDDDVSE
jgi:hypothetical protein